MEIPVYLLVTLLLCVLLPRQSETIGRKVFCYYSSFAQNRHGVGHFVPEDIDPYLCSHIIYAFVDISHDGTKLKPNNHNDIGRTGLYARTIALKKQNPNLKVLLAVGGWSIGSKPFVPMMSSETNRRIWVKNVPLYLRRYGFDGLDMDWEFPAVRGSPPEDKQRFTLLMKDLQQAFREEAAQTGKPKLLLTLATAGGMYFIRQSYEPELLIPHLDYMLLMAYNYHGLWEKFTGHHSGMYPRSDETGAERELNQKWTIDFWKSKGARNDQLILGLATYGMSFTLADSTQHGLKAPALGGGSPGKYTKETGILSYFEICENAQTGWLDVWVDEQQVPYCYGGNQWVGYDNVKSITYKANNIIAQNLGGAFVWSVEMDDFSNHCGGGRYPLLTTINNILKGNGPVSPSIHTNEVVQHNVHPSRDPWKPSNHGYNNLHANPVIQNVHHSYNSVPTTHSTTYQHGAKSNFNQVPSTAPSYNHLSSKYSSKSEGGATTTESTHRAKQPFTCTSPGIHGDPMNCRRYFVCIKAYSSWYKYPITCPGGLAFNAKMNACFGTCVA